MNMKKKIRFGLYGCNMYRTRDLMEGAQSAAGEAAEVVASFDIDREKAEFAANKYGGKAFFNERDFLACPDIDVVLISLPAYLHADALVHTVEAGKDIYVEKPICVDSVGRRKIVDVMKKSTVKCYVGLSYRYIAPFKKVAEIVRRPEAGPIIGVHHHWQGYWVPTPLSERGWRHSFEKSGGQLIHHCCHLLDWFRWIGGDMKSVSAVNYTPEGVELPHEEREISAAFSYKNGGIAVFNLSQDSHQYVQFGTVHTKNYGISYQWGQETFVKVFSTRPRAADETYEWSLTNTPGDGGEKERTSLQMKDFIDSYLQGKDMPVNLNDGLRIYDFATAIRHSCKSGVRVDLLNAGFAGFSV